MATAQKSNKHFWTKVSIALGFVALFICGMAVGLSVNRGTLMKRGPVTEIECAELEKNIMFMEDAREQRRLSAFYNRHCWKKDKRRGVEKSSEGARPADTQLQSKDMPKKVPEIRIVKAQKPTEKTCAVIEDKLLKQIDLHYGENDSVEAGYYLARAQIYVNLSNRGCPENSEAYEQLALQDIEVARALKDDRFYNEYEVEAVVDTYKRLEMKGEAERAFNTIKKMTDPAIDFILQVEKIINE